MNNLFKKSSWIYNSKHPLEIYENALIRILLFVGKKKMMELSPLLLFDILNSYIVISAISEPIPINNGMNDESWKMEWQGSCHLGRFTYEKTVYAGQVYRAHLGPLSYSCHAMIWHDAQFRTHQTITCCWIESKKNYMVKILLKFKVVKSRARIIWYINIHCHLSNFQG